VKCWEVLEELDSWRLLEKGSAPSSQLGAVCRCKEDIKGQALSLLPPLLVALLSFSPFSCCICLSPYSLFFCSLPNPVFISSLVTFARTTALRHTRDASLEGTALMQHAEFFGTTFREVVCQNTSTPLSLSWFSVCAVWQCLKHFIVFSTLVTL
jgi:hypothetical protein